LLRLEQHHPTLGVVGAQDHLLRREVDHGDDVTPEQLLEPVMPGALGARPRDAERPDVDPQPVRQPACLGKLAGVSDDAYPDVDLVEVGVLERGPRARPEPRVAWSEPASLAGWSASGAPAAP